MAAEELASLGHRFSAAGVRARRNGDSEGVVAEGVSMPGEVCGRVVTLRCSLQHSPQWLFRQYSEHISHFQRIQFAIPANSFVRVTKSIIVLVRGFAGSPARIFRGFLLNQRVLGWPRPETLGKTTETARRSLWPAPVKLSAHPKRSS